MRPSALTTRLSAYVHLTDEERAAIASLETQEVRIASGERLMEQGAPNQKLYIVQQGWLHSSTRLQTGGRQILRFHYPGDLVGISSIAWAKASVTLTAVSDCIVAELVKPELGRIFAQQPRLSGLLYAMAAAETVAMSDRLTSVGRMDAIGRLSTLLLDILARLRVTAGGVVNSFDMPLTQTDLGDAVGLTKVHVSRTLGEMERQGLIERSEGRRLRINDPDALARAVGFVDRYGEIETDWLPPPRLAA